MKHKKKTPNSHPKMKQILSLKNLGKGSHSVELLEGANLKFPVLIRVVAKEFESLGKNKEVLAPMVHQNAVHLLTDNKDVKYYECTSDLPLQVEAIGNKTLRILSRLEFSDSMGQEASYRIRVREGKKVIGTYYFNTERSSVSQIKGRDYKVPGKWRSCEISVMTVSYTHLTLPTTPYV